MKILQALWKLVKQVGQGAVLQLLQELSLSDDPKETVAKATKLAAMRRSYRP